MSTSPIHEQPTLPPPGDGPPSQPQKLLPAPGDTTAPEVYHPTIATLLRQIAKELSALFTAEVALAKSEIRETVEDTKRTAIHVGAGLYLVLLASLALVAAAILGLSNVVAPWLAATIVGVVLLVAGGVALWMGKESAEDISVAPERTLRDFEKNKDVLVEGLSELNS